VPLHRAQTLTASALLASAVLGPGSVWAEGVPAPIDNGVLVEQRVGAETNERDSTAIALAEATKQSLQAATQALALAIQINGHSEMLLRDLKAVREELEELRAASPQRATMTLAPLWSAGSAEQKVSDGSAATGSLEPNLGDDSTATAADAPQFANGASAPIPPKRPTRLVARIKAALPRPGQSQRSTQAPRNQAVSDRQLGTDAPQAHPAL
jgi:hypothetical protein